MRTVLTVDVAIVGGGMVGASLALAIAQTPLSVALIEAVDPAAVVAQPSFDDRTTALGNGSRRTFEALGVWSQMASEAAPIRCIHVSDAGRYGFARLIAADEGIDAFGYVIVNRAIGRALWSALGAAPRLHRLMPARATGLALQSDAVDLSIESDIAAAPQRLSARLLVAADGAGSVLRAALGLASHIEDYQQVALIANLCTDRPHEGIAYERFTPTGPLALLPLADDAWGLVWTLAPSRAAEVLACSDARFLQELQRVFGWRAGRFTRVGRRASYPLQLTRADGTVASRAVLIGNAAQALHPVAGQGFNLGLRDAATLAELLADARAAVPDGEPFDAGDAALLAAFAARRAADRGGVTRFTDGLVKLFGNSLPGVGAARDLGLLLFDLSPTAKSEMSRLSWGFAGETPRLARGLALAR